MKPKTIVTALLLVFVLASVGYAITRQVNKTDSGDEATIETEARYVVFYFHGAKRCQTCMTMEAYAREAVDEEMAAALEDGTLIWRTVDISQPENEALAKEFGVSYSSVAVAEIKDGKTLRFEVFEKTWELVREKDAYLTYIRSGVRSFVGASE